jgi:hypothetical protein
MPFVYSQSLTKSWFAYDIPRINKSVIVLIQDMKKSLEAMTKVLKESGLNANESKNRAVTVFIKEM